MNSPLSDLLTPGFELPFHLCGSKEKVLNKASKLPVVRK